MAAVIDCAAFLVRNKWCMAFFSLVSKENIFETLTIIREIKNVPQKQLIIIRILPKTVKGTVSPNPTVVNAITTHQIELK